MDTSMSTSPITNVSDTALWVATYRAGESERSDALFHDPYARRLAGERGEAIVRAMPRGRSMGWPMVVRTAVMDELILRAVDREGVDTVVNLASGLDARPFRLPLPAALRWFDVDLPPMLEYKRSALQHEVPRCALEFVPADLSDPTARRTVLDRVNAGSRTTLVVTEGLLIYLPADAVRSLAADLAAQPTFRWWLTDLAGPKLLKMLEKTWSPVLRKGNAPLQFAPAESTAFFEPFGWREAEFRPTWTESLRLKRTVPMAWFWNLLGTLAPRRVREEQLRMSGIAFLERERVKGTA